MEEKKILDSGARVEFDSGAVRDIKEGKGRMDLVPLDVLAYLANSDEQSNKAETEIWNAKEGLSDQAITLNAIERYKETLDIKYLHVAYDAFTGVWFGRNKNKTILSLWIELSKHYEAGAKKYEERNWQKGIPVHSFIDSASRHFLKYIYGETDENHDIAFVWNIVGAIWTHMHRPDLIDINLKEILMITKGE